MRGWRWGWDCGWASTSGLLRAALATEALGLSADAIETLQRDEIAWERLLLRFHHYHEFWRDKGFIPMFRHLLQEENIRTQMLRLGDGERRLTNLLHLGELLHHATVIAINGDSYRMRAHRDAIRALRPAITPTTRFAES